MAICLICFIKKKFKKTKKEQYIVKDCKKIVKYCIIKI